jgi:spectinomycin phosphotransferase
MRPPTEAALRQALAIGFGVEAAELELEGDGADAAAYAWRVTAADGRRLFLKLRPELRPAAVLVPRHLRSLGWREVVAALPTVSGDAWLAIADWTAVLMDLVDGRTAFRAGMELPGWTRLGRLAARLHAVELPADLAAIVPVEDFRPKATDRARELDDRIRDLEPAGLDEHASAVRRAWLEHRATIAAIVAATDALSARIRDRLAADSRAPLVLCHADFHAGNVLVDRDGGIHVVDWDEVVFAPRERDLMFVRGSVVAGVVTNDEADAFEAGYGRVTIDRELLGWYRLDWAVQDLAGFASEVLFDPDRVPSTRPRARRIFEDLFGADDEVAGALAISREIAAGP